MVNTGEAWPWVKWFTVDESNPNEDASWSGKSFFEEDSGWHTTTTSIYLTWGGVKHRTLIFNSQSTILFHHVIAG